MLSSYRIVTPYSSILEQLPATESAIFVADHPLPYIQCECRPEQVTAVQSWCAEHQLDIGAVASFRRSEVAVVAMDMDSTLITIECIDEIADFIGKKDAVARITESAMRGEIPFVQALHQRVALLAGLPVASLEAVYRERVQLSLGAKSMIEAFQAAGAHFLLVSGGFTFFTDRLKELLGFNEAYANTLEIEHGILTGRVVGDILDGAAKAAYVAHVRENKRQAGRHAVIAVGDGSNDRLMFAESDAGVAYHAKPILEEIASHRIRHGGLDTMLVYFSA